MENNEQVADISTNNDVVADDISAGEVVEPVIESNSDATNRVKELEAEVAKFKRMAQQKAKKAEKSEASPSKAEEIQSGELDYGQLAYLTAKGIENQAEIELAQKVVEESGRELKDVVNSDYFKSELKNLREAKAADEAVPKGTKRSGNSPRDSVDYWIAKGELPPAENIDLRRQVVNAKRQKATQQSKFTDHPVVK